MSRARDRLQALLEGMIDSGDATAASASVGDGRRLLVEARAGWRAQGVPIRRWDRFDLASLTKLWTATLALVLDRRGLLPIATPLGEIWPQASGTAAKATLESLLRHRSGMVAWRPLYRSLRHPRRLVSALLAEPSWGAARPTYSDLGYMLWVASAERACGQSPGRLMERFVMRPLGLASVDDAPPTAQSVGSSLGNEREVELANALGIRVGPETQIPPGTPQDGNARFIGGYGGHAGLFGPARALWRLGAEWLSPGRLLTRQAVNRALEGGGPLALGWWRSSRTPRSTGGLSASCFGHHGFTGGSLWIDPEHRRVLVLLAHRATVATDLDPWRERFHRLAATA